MLNLFFSSASIAAYARNKGAGSQDQASRWEFFDFITHIDHGLIFTPTQSLPLQGIFQNSVWIKDFYGLSFKECHVNGFDYARIFYGQIKLFGYKIYAGNIIYIRSSGDNRDSLNNLGDLSCQFVCAAYVPRQQADAMTALIIKHYDSRIHGLILD